MDDTEKSRQPQRGLRLVRTDFSKNEREPLRIYFDWRGVRFDADCPAAAAESFAAFRGAALKWCGIHVTHAMEADGASTAALNAQWRKELALLAPADEVA